MSAADSTPHRIARMFLLTIAVIIGILLLIAIVWNVFQDDLLRAAYVPDDEFSANPLPAAPDYDQLLAWAAHPELVDGPAQMLPEGFVPEENLGVPVFYIHPTTYLQKARWNAPIDDLQSRSLVDNFVMKTQANVFNSIGPVWAPRYRQATFGAFFDQEGNGQKALQSAFGDVQSAFDHFVEKIGDRPFLLAGHSQGSLHGLTLLLTRIGSSDLKNRLVGAYLVGWPISVESDLPAFRIPACQDPDDHGCLSTWQSFAPDGDPTAIKEAFMSLPSFTGQPRVNDEMLCVNPLSGAADSQTIAADGNAGGLTTSPEGEPLPPLKPDLVGAACGDDGILYLTNLPGDGFNQSILPGQNYHVYDYNMFWANVRANARRRVEAFLASTTDASR